jgi:hypothetical protein
MTATISPSVIGAATGAVIGFLGILVGLWVNGDRAERQRRRELHARSLAVALAYGEMPFMIRRRRVEGGERSAERVRLSDHFSAVKAEISTCQVLLGADGRRAISAAYDDLVAKACEVVGSEARRAWEEEPIGTDAEMNMGPLFERLQAFREQLGRFEEALAWGTLPRRQRFARRISGRKSRS